jgi:hypothetical protein
MKTQILIASVALATLTLAAGTQAGPTNLLEKVSFQLKVDSQGKSSTNSDGTITRRIVSKALTSWGLIQALGTDTNLTTNGFSSGAYLAFDTVVTNGTNLPPILVVVEGAGTNLTLTPVGSDIQIGTLSVVLHDGIIRTNGTDMTTAYRIKSVDIDITNQWSLNLRGLGVRNVLDAGQGWGKSAIKVDSNDILWTLSGYGNEGADTNSTPVIVTGTVSAHSSKISY